MKKSNTFLIGFILERIDRIQLFLQGKEIEEFSKSEILQDAVIRNLEVIGQASKDLSEKFRLHHPQIKWNPVIKMGHKLEKETSQINADFLWTSIDQIIMPFKTDLLELSNITE
ncbi:HepT-like ribonuclease domain-containing protein [Nonlabens antarcticus]|uniref:HepT-like ribonuclease domain-containing protein n=1 Tax=Nonlabens antarcticus TaxID=392714 RepID=UPI001890B6C0|nr:HepT-like ribonuclease domain-containing protein [Nonlabens antarcticus]